MTEDITELLNSLNKAIDIQKIEVAALKEKKEQSLKCIDMFFKHVIYFLFPLLQ